MMRFVLVCLCAGVFFGCSNGAPEEATFAAASLDPEDDAIIQLECENQFLDGCGPAFHDDVEDCIVDVTVWVEGQRSPECVDLVMLFLDCENEDPCWVENDPSICDESRNNWVWQCT